MVLSGIVVNSVLSAGTTFLKAIAEERVSAIVLWLMGSLSGAAMTDALVTCTGTVVLFAVAEWWGRDLDAISSARNESPRCGQADRGRDAPGTRASPRRLRRPLSG